MDWRLGGYCYLGISGVRMTKTQTKALVGIAEAVVETVKEAGDNGAPGSYIYVALMNIGLNLQSFEAIMGALVIVGKLRKRGETYYAV